MPASPSKLEITQEKIVRCVTPLLDITRSKLFKEVMESPKPVVTDEVRKAEEVSLIK